MAMAASLLVMAQWLMPLLIQPQLTTAIVQNDQLFVGLGDCSQWDVFLASPRIKRVDAFDPSYRPLSLTTYYLDNDHGCRRNGFNKIALVDDTIWQVTPTRQFYYSVLAENMECFTDDYR